MHMLGYPRNIFGAYPYLVITDTLDYLESSIIVSPTTLLTLTNRGQLL